jgi:hypothetical protein
MTEAWQEQLKNQMDKTKSEDAKNGKLAHKMKKVKMLKMANSQTHNT